MHTSRRAVSALVTLAALVSACSGAAEVGSIGQPTSSAVTEILPPTVEPTAPSAIAVPEPTAPSATAVPEPTAPSATAVPEPTAVADATAVPEPTAVADATAVPEPTAPSDASLVPAFVDPPEELTSLIGTVYRDGLPQFDAQANISALGQGTIINTADPGEAWRALAYGLEGDRIPLAVSAIIERNDEGQAIWQLESIWMLHVGPDARITLGNDVCKGERVTHRYGQELFFVVTNAAQDTALGAWIITIDGPVPYPDFADLTCEEFFP